MRYYICLELGGTNLRTAVVDENNKVIKFNKISSNILSDAVDKSYCIANQLIPLINEIGKENVIVVTMALASLLDNECKYVFSSPNVREFDNINLKEEVENILDIPVVLEKDVNALLLYEIEKLNLETEGITCGFFLGTGLGNVFSINGKIYRGFTGSSSELGHIPVPDFENKCGCGKRGCIELKASGKVLAGYAKKFRCDIKDIFVKYGEKKEIENVVRYFAYAIASEITILDPRNIILGGGVVTLPNFPLRRLEDLVKENVRAPYPRKSIYLRLASNDDYAGVVGAVLNAKQHNFN